MHRIKASKRATSIKQTLAALSILERFMAGSAIRKMMIRPGSDELRPANAVPNIRDPNQRYYSSQQVPEEAETVFMSVRQRQAELDDPGASGTAAEPSRRAAPEVERQSDGNGDAEATEIIPAAQARRRSAISAAGRNLRQKTPSRPAATQMPPMSRHLMICQG